MGPDRTAPSTTLNEWKEQPDRVLARSVKNVPTLLKAFYGATLWTLAEVNTLRACLKWEGIEVYKTTHPKAGALVYTSPITGDPRLL